MRRLTAHPLAPQFLKYDRKVLRFYMAWDDRNSLYGELRPFVLHYYLADDTMEILEVSAVDGIRWHQIAVEILEVSAVEGIRGHQMASDHR